MNEQARKGDFPPEAAPPVDDELLEELEERDADIAAEHDDLTVGEQERGGPEGAAEDEAPQGYGGADLPGNR
jgi:hypothetical protein